jgi:uncharacterized membrane protein
VTTTRADLAAVGGGAGRHSRRPSFAGLVWPLVLLSMVPMQAAVLERAYCIEHGWNSQEQFWRACFSDLPIQYQVGHLSGGLTAYLSGDASVAHPPVTGAVMSLLGGFVGPGPIVAQQRQYFLLWAVLAAALVMGTVWLTAATRPLRPGLAAHVALSPVLVTAALVSSDVVGVALVAAGLYAWSRRRPELAGVLLGLGVAARIYPLLVLAVIAVLGVRAGRTTPVARLLLAAGVTLAVVLGVFAVVNPRAISDPLSTWWSSPAGLGSPWVVPQLIAAAGRADTAPGIVATIGNAIFAVIAHPVPTGLATTLSVLGVVVALVVGAVLALTAPRRPAIAEVVLVVLGIVLVTGKSFPVQTSLWLLPLVALVGLPRRDHLIWAAAEFGNFVAVWLYSGGLSRPDRGLPPGWYSIFVLLRLAAVVWLVWCTWRRAMDRPAHEPEPRWPDDPDRDAVVDGTAGAFPDAPDAVVATFR